MSVDAVPEEPEPESEPEEEKASSAVAVTFPVTSVSTNGVATYNTPVSSSGWIGPSSEPLDLTPANTVMEDGQLRIYQDDLSGIVYAEIEGCTAVRGRGLTSLHATEDLALAITSLIDFSNGDTKLSLHPMFEEEIKRIKVWAKNLGLYIR